MPRNPLLLQTDAEALDRLTRASHGRGKRGSVLKADLSSLLDDHSRVVGLLHPDQYREPEEKL